MKEALKKALEFEEEGYGFYKKISLEINQPLAKRLFESLAQQEKEHMERINKIYKEIQKGGDPEIEDDGESSQIENEVKKIFEALDETKRKAPLDHIEGYKLAMEMEKKGLNMYKKNEENSTGKLKAFFNALKREEQQHLTALENVYFYLTKPGDWLAEDESRIWNWMNT